MRHVERWAFERRSDWKSTATDGKKRPTLAMATQAAHFLFSELILTRVCVAFFRSLIIHHHLSLSHFFVQNFFSSLFPNFLALRFFVVSLIHFAVYFVENTPTTLRSFFDVNVFVLFYFYTDTLWLSGMFVNLAAFQLVLLLRLLLLLIVNLSRILFPNGWERKERKWLTQKTK